MTVSSISFRFLTVSSDSAPAQDPILGSMESQGEVSMARQWRTFEPGYSPATYTRTGIQSLSDAELRKEYSRVRREATERLRSFSRSKDPMIRGAAILAEKQGLYLTQKQIQSSGEGRGLMEDLLLDAMKFLQSKRSTVSGTREIESRTARSLQAAGYDIEKKDLKSFGQFMDYARDRRDSRRYGSGTVAKTFDQAKKQGISRSELQKHYKYYVEQIQRGAEELTKWKK